MMTPHEAWTLLQSRPRAPAAGTYRMRLLDQIAELSIFAVVDEDTGHPGLAIAIPEEFRPTRQVAHAGKRVTIQYIAGGGMGEDRMALLVSLRDSETVDLFGHLCANLISRIRTSADCDTAMESVAEEVDRWRRFMEKHRSPLDQQAVIALIGELAVLERLSRRIGPRAALASWRSPQGSLRDFELPDATIEVKTYTASSGGVVHINDPMQLEPDSGRAVFLACQEVVRDESGNQRLPDHVARVRSLLQPDTSLPSDFERLLAESGYLPDHATEYPENLRLGELRVLRVTGGFPRLSPSAVPLGVTHVRFGLTVASLLQYEVDATTSVGPAGPPQGCDQ